MFASRDFREKAVVGSHYESLTYTDFGEHSRSRMQYGQRCSEVTTQSFWKCAVEREGEAFHSKGQECFVWVVPALFRVMRYMKDSPYQERDREESDSRGIQARKPNV